MHVPTTTPSRRLFLLALGVVMVAAATLVAIGSPTAGASGGGAHPDHVDVFSGGDRYETAAQIALDTYPEDYVEVLYIANGETLVDAVVVGVTTDAPSKMLLVKRDEVPEPTRKALQQIDHARLVFLGGDAVISPAVRAEVESLTDNYAYPN